MGNVTCRCVGLALLACAAVTVSAGDPAPDLDRIAHDALARAEADAKACDETAMGGDSDAWAKARDQYLERAAASLASIETALLRVSTDAGPESSGGQAAIETHERISRARLLYAAVTAKARSHADLALRKDAWVKVAGEAGLAQKSLAIPSIFKSKDLRRRAEIVKATDNISSLLKYYIASGAGISKPWPKHSGKAFVLWLVATNQLDRRDPQQLSILFSPGDTARSLKQAGGIEAFATITKELLSRGGTDLSRLTSYVGRRNADQAHLLSADELSRGAPAIADLSFGDVAIVGFVSGLVKVMTKADLGLGLDDPIVAGDASKSPILRALSD